MDLRVAGRHLSTAWQKAGSIFMALAFIAIFFWLTSRQYQRFDLVAPDVATFSQAIWNTLHGRFLYSTIVERSILAYHFSPLMAALAPLLLIWEDVRVLFLAQTVAIALCGLILYRLVREEHPTLAPWFLLAFYLNPALHEVALHELRRVIFAMPFLALALYGLARRRYRLLALALFGALLFKEDIALIVLMAGVYLLLFRRNLRWGAPLAVLGLVWAVGVTFWLIPAFGPREGYAQLNYYARWGDSPLELATVFLRRPGDVLAWVFAPAALRSLLRVFVPLGLVLPFLAADVLLLALPPLLLALLSGYGPMHRLENWYMAPILPLLAGALAIAIRRLSRPRAARVVYSLLFTTLAGFLLFSQAPLGGRFVVARYQVTPHEQVAAELVEAVPPSAAVVVQDAYLAHFARREHLRLFPWVRDEAPIDYYVLDRHLRSYPLSNEEVNREIDDLVADPAIAVTLEGDGAYLLAPGGPALPSFEVDAVAEATMLLERVEVAVARPGHFFEPVAETPVPVAPGETVRVSLYWRALGRPPGERSVSVRLMSPEGQLLAQHDMQPSGGARRTSWWEPGWYFRDVYYLALPSDLAAGEATLAVTLYDSFSHDPVPFDTGEVVLPLLPVAVEGPVAIR